MTLAPPSWRRRSFLLQDDKKGVGSFWGGLWGIPFGLLIQPAWMRLYCFGLVYFLVPVLVLFTIFLPMSGAGYFGLQQGAPCLRSTRC
jgi:hypothetical protein